MLKLMPQRNYEETLQEIKRLVNSRRPDITITATENFDSSVFKTDPEDLRINIIVDLYERDDENILNLIYLFRYMLEKNYGTTTPKTDEDSGCTFYVRLIYPIRGKYNVVDRMDIEQGKVTLYKDGVWYV